MNKVLVNVYVPILNKAYDIFIPQSSRMYEILDLIKKAVVELSEGRFIANENNIICFSDNGEILDINLSVYELGILNGSRLILI